MKTHRLFIISFFAIALIALAGIPTKPQIQVQNGEVEVFTAGRNVNMVAGNTLPDGDPYLQRQNEPSMAVSSRNPLHLLAGANDYRTVDMPIVGEELPGIEEIAAADAWLGYYTSYDGGESWKTALLPGFPQDIVSTSPLKAYTTAADPWVCAGSEGLFYYSGLAFNRGDKDSAIFVARFEDTNDNESGNTIEYRGATIVALGNAGQFVDMPRMAVDVPRGASNDYVYLVYTNFVGNLDVTIRSKMYCTRSTDGGLTWSSPTKLSESQHIIQGAAIAIDPENGDVYVALRRFYHKSQENGIVVVKSTDRGQTFSSPMEIALFPTDSFDQPATTFYEFPTGESFRTNTYPTIAVDDNHRVFVAWSQRNMGPINAARIVMKTSIGGSSWSSLMQIDPAGIDPYTGLPYDGHHFMPQMVFSAGKLTMVWYDQRNDYSGNDYGWDYWISDGEPVRHTIDVWAAQADANTFPTLNWSYTQVSRYIYAALTDEEGNLIPDAIEPIVFPVQFNCPNLPMFKGGTLPFMGDYIGLAASPTIIVDDNGNWIFNTAHSDNPIFHAVWTDNRDVRSPTGLYDWTMYVPVYSQEGYVSQDRAECFSDMPNQPAIRNQNIYTSKLTWGIAAGSPTNNKSLDLQEDVARAFVIYVKNNTGDFRNFGLEITNQPPDGSASFLQFDVLTDLDVTIAPYSTISRPVFVKSSDLDATIKIAIWEYDEFWTQIGNDPISYIILNGDPSDEGVSGGEEDHIPIIDDPENPNIVNWVCNPNIVNPNIVNPNIVNPNIVNPNIVNPNIVNPNIVNPNIVNPNIVNPNIVNPNIVNPNIVNPNIVNPNIVNPNIVNPNIVNAPDPEDVVITDVIWTVRNEATNASSFTLKTLAKKSPPPGIYTQLLIYRVHTTPAVAGQELSTTYGNYESCTLMEEPHHELLLNIVNPNIVNPNIVNPNIVNPNIVNSAIENASFTLGPAEEALVDLRVLDTKEFTGSGSLATQNRTSIQAFDLQDYIDHLGFAVTAHAVGSADVRAGKTTPRTTATDLYITTGSVDGGLEGSYYEQFIEATGGTPPYSWDINWGQLPSGLDIILHDTPVYNYAARIYGTPDPGTAGIYEFMIQATDADGKTAFARYALIIHAGVIPTSPSIVTTSLPIGIINDFYGATLLASGGNPPLTWTWAAGTTALPDGLSMDAGGVITGYPTNDGTYDVAITVTDLDGDSDTQNFPLVILPKTNVFIKISGYVYDETSGDPLEGVLMRGLPNEPYTDAAGYYEDDVRKEWEGTVIPFMVGHTFDPTHRVYTSAETVDHIPNQDYNIGAVSPASKLVFTQSPNGGVGGVPWTMQPIVEVQDAAGNRVTSDDSTVVTLDIENNPGNGSLSGSFSMPVTDGVATFAGLSIDKGGWGYTLDATSNPPLIAATSEAFGIEGFSNTGSMNAGRARHTATYLVNDKVLIAGGAKAPNELSAELYEPSTGSFTNLGNVMSVGPKIDTATVLANNKVLLIGIVGITSAAEIFDPADNSFTPVGTTNYSRGGHAATLFQDGRVLIAGGGDNLHGNTAEIYDPVSGTFVLVADTMGESHLSHTSTLLPNGKVLIVGGTNQGTLPPIIRDNAYLFDPATEEFTLIGVIPGGSRCNHTATLLNDGTVLIAGGLQMDSDPWLPAPLNTALIYNPYDGPNGSFTLLSTNMNDAHSGHQAALKRDGKVLLMGETAEIYDPDTQQFHATGQLDQSRQDSAAAVLQDGQILVTGSYAFTNSAEIWNPYEPFPTHVISGTITYNSSGVGGVLLDGLPGHPMTNYGGLYEGLVLDSWSGTVIPVKPGYTFNPAYIEYADVIGDISNQDYAVVSVPEPIPEISLSITEMTSVTTEEVTPPSQIFQVSNSGEGTLNYDVTTNVAWINIGPEYGTSTGPPNDHTVTFVVSGLIPGTYNGIIEITSGEASNSPQTISVTLTIQPTPVISFTPGAMIFEAIEGGANPPSQTLQVSNSGGGTLEYTITAPPAWADVSPTSGSSTGDPNSHSVSIDISGYDYGTYISELVINSPIATNSPQQVDLTLKVYQPTISIIGRITTSEDTGVDGVELNGFPGNPVTVSGGYYEAIVDSGFTAEVTPIKAGYTFSPPTRSYDNVRYPQSDQNYTAIPEVPPPTIFITTTALLIGVEGASYSGTLQAANGTPPLTWDYAGSLPNGIVLNSNGTITGIPTESGAFNFTAEVTDATLQSATKALSLVVAEWIEFYDGGGDDTVSDIGVDPMGNIYVTGQTERGTSGIDYYTAKYNDSGVMVWEKYYNGPGNGDDIPDSLEVDALGNVYVTGISLGLGTGEDYATIKYTTDGDLAWTGSEFHEGAARYSSAGALDDWARDIEVDSSGNVYVTGISDSNFATIKYKADGSLAWTGPGFDNGAVRHASATGSRDWAYAMDVDSSGNIYVTGHTVDAGTGPDITTIKYNPDGSRAWDGIGFDNGAVRWDSPIHGDDFGWDICVDRWENIIVTGKTETEFGTNISDYATIKYNPDGTAAWSGPGFVNGVVTYNGPGDYHDYSYYVTLDNQGNIYIAGSSSGSDTSSSYDWATIRYNPDGTTSWNGPEFHNGAARYDGPDNFADFSNAIIVDPLGYVYVAGMVSSNSYYDSNTIKYGSDGSVQWIAQYNGPGLRADQAIAIVLDTLGNVYVSGSSDNNKNPYDSDIATLKYPQSFPSTLEIATVDLDVGYVGVDYAGAVWAFGGSGSREWSITSGNLPHGLSLDTLTGIISGIPISAGNFTFTINVQDGNLESSKQLSIRTISPTITTIAGNGTAGYSGDGNEAINATINQPEGVLVDSSGNVYIADTLNHCVRKVDSISGVITTYAGTGVAGYSGDGGPATDAQLNRPIGLAMDLSGNLYIADFASSSIRKVDSGGTITTVAGTGTTGFSGDGGLAVNAHLGNPRDVEVDSLGNIYIADTNNHRIRKVDVGTGIINTVAGGGLGPDIGDGGLATDAVIGWPGCVLVDTSGNLFIASNKLIRRVDASTQIITTWAGSGLIPFSGDGTPKLDCGMNPYGMEMDELGNLYYADPTNNAVFRVDVTLGIITRAAGNGTSTYNGDGIPATDASMRPLFVTVDALGNLYVADRDNNRIRKVGDN